jgi:CDP-diacylglycerol--glycerol-3-phosphate 3-phosphatidyltransferase
MKIREIFEDRICTFSNFLTVIRIIAAPFLGYCIYLESKTGYSVYIYYEIVLLVIIIFSDFFDGFLARLMNQVTKLGQFLDPLADKFAGIIALTFLVLYKDFPLWVYILILVREALAVTAGVILFAKKDVDVKPNFFGKLFACSLALVGTAYIFSLDYSFLGITLKQFSVFLVVLFYILGGFQYAKTYIRYYIDKKS